MSKFAVGQVVRVVDDESGYNGYAGMIRQIIGIDFGVSNVVDQYIVEFSNWPDGYAPTCEFIERQLVDAPDAIL